MVWKLRKRGKIYYGRSQVGSKDRSVSLHTRRRSDPEEIVRQINVEDELRKRGVKKIDTVVDSMLKADSGREVR